MRTLILVAAMAVNAAAATVSYDFAGEVWSTWGADAIPVDDIVGITTGDLVVGSFTIDLDIVGQQDAQGNEFNLGYLDSVIDFDIVVGDLSFVHNLDDVRVVSITNNAVNHDRFGMTTFITTDNIRAVARATISDSTAQMFSDLSLDNAVNLPFGDDLRKLLSLDFIATEERVNIDWQTLTMRSPVPEPSAIVLLIFGLLICQCRNVLRLS